MRKTNQMTYTAVATAKDDHKMAASILDRLGYTLQDLSLEYGDVVIADGDISHQLYYGSDYSNANIIGYIWVEGGIYYTRINNYRTPEEAALELIPSILINRVKTEIEAERSVAVDYN